VNINSQNVSESESTAVRLSDEEFASQKYIRSLMSLSYDSVKGTDMEGDWHDIQGSLHGTISKDERNAVQKVADDLYQSGILGATMAAAADILPGIPFVDIIDPPSELTGEGMQGARNIIGALGMLGGLYKTPAVNIKGGSYLSRKSVEKGFKAVKKDPMLSDIPFEEHSTMVKYSRNPEFTAAYSPLGGKEIMRRGGKIYDEPPDYLSIGSPSTPAFEFQEQSLLQILSHGNILRPRWGEMMVRHEGRHHKQDLEGLQNYIRKHMGKTMERPITKDYYEGYSTLIELPKPKNWKKVMPKEAFDSKGNMKNLVRVGKEAKERGGEKYAKEYMDFYLKQVHKYGYYSSKVEVEARLEEIASAGKKIVSTNAYKDLKNKAGYTDEQIKKMLFNYKSAKIKKYPLTKELKEVGYVTPIKREL
jgi:hypothetical protein